MACKATEFAGQPMEVSNINGSYKWRTAKDMDSCRGRLRGHESMSALQKHVSKD